MQSGHARIEHSYEADSGLSDEGREYAYQLRDFITARRASSAAQRRAQPGASPDEEERKLTVCRAL